MRRSLLQGEKTAVTVAGNGVWDTQARKLAGIMQPLVTWAREKKGARIEDFALSRIVLLHSLEEVIQERFLSICGADAKESAIDLTGMPEDVFVGIRSYLDELPGWRAGAHSEVASQQHSYVLWSIKPYLPALLA